MESIRGDRLVRDDGAGTAREPRYRRAAARPAAGVRSALWNRVRADDVSDWLCARTRREGGLDRVPVARKTEREPAERVRATPMRRCRRRELIVAAAQCDRE